MANRIVDEFEFNSDFGFSGSAGKQPVRGYMRGGRVKKESCKCGGEVHGMKKGGSAKKSSKRRESKKMDREAEKLVDQIINQAMATGRVPGVPKQSRGVPVAPRSPMIPLKQ